MKRRSVVNFVQGPQPLFKSRRCIPHNGSLSRADSGGFGCVFECPRSLRRSRSGLCLGEATTLDRGSLYDFVSSLCRRVGSLAHVRSLGRRRGGYAEARSAQPCDPPERQLAPELSGRCFCDLPRRPSFRVASLRSQAHRVCRMALGGGGYIARLVRCAERLCRALHLPYTAGCGPCAFLGASHSNGSMVESNTSRSPRADRPVSDSDPLGPHDADLLRHRDRMLPTSGGLNLSPVLVWCDLSRRC